MCVCIHNSITMGPNRPRRLAKRTLILQFALSTHTHKPHTMIVALVEIVLAVLFLLLGCTLCFFGYRLFRFSLFTIAFITGGAIALVLVLLVVPDLTDMSDLALLVYILGGGFFGFLSILLISTGVFIAGFCGGFLLLSLFMALIGYFGSVVALLLVTITVGVIGGIVALKNQKPVVVVTSSLLGAMLLGSGVVYFAEMAMVSSSSRLYDDSQYNDLGNSINGMYWTMYAILLALFGVGMLVQFTLTGKGTYHNVTTDETPFEDQIQYRQDPVCYENLPTPTNVRIVNGSDVSKRV